jgi:beta-lactamase class A
MNNEELQKRNKILEKRWKILLAIAILFLITRPVALYITRNYIHKAVENATTNKYPLLDPARQLVPQSDYIINLQPLREYLQDLGAQYPDMLTIYYEQLNSGANISVNQELHLYPASLSKIALAMIVAHKVEKGVWKWDTKLDHTAANLSSDSGELYKTIGDGPTTIDKLLSELLINSDNTAQNILRKNVAIEDYLSLQEETGLEELYNDQGFISAKEYSRMVRVLYTSSYLERDDSQKILELMTKSTFRDYLSQGIPEGIKFAHKYGENMEQSIFADSGIVYDNGHPYMITVLIKGKDSSEKTRKSAVDLMKNISQKAFELKK